MVIEQARLAKGLVAACSCSNGKQPRLEQGSRRFRWLGCRHLLVRHPLSPQQAAALQQRPILLRGLRVMISPSRLTQYPGQQEARMGQLRLRRLTRREQGCQGMELPKRLAR